MNLFCEESGLHFFCSNRINSIFFLSFVRPIEPVERKWISTHLGNIHINAERLSVAGDDDAEDDDAKKWPEADEDSCELFCYISVLSICINSRPIYIIINLHLRQGSYSSSSSVAGGAFVLTSKCCWRNCHTQWSSLACLPVSSSSSGWLNLLIVLQLYNCIKFSFCDHNINIQEIQKRHHHHPSLLPGWWLVVLHGKMAICTCCCCC